MSETVPNKDAPTQATFISVAQAVEIAKKRGVPCTHATMIVWIKENDLGYQALGKGCRWNVNKIKLEEFLTHGPKKQS